MAKANYPGNMPAFSWNQTGTNYLIGALLYALEGASRERRTPGKERIAARGKEEV
jgi:hypothetical protein